MKKRIIAFLLAALMVFTLAACGAKEETTTPAEKQEPQTEQQPAAEQETEEPANEDWKTEHPTWLTPEKVTFTVMTSTGSVDSPDASNDVEFWAWLEDYTNVHIEWEVIPYEGSEEVTKTRLAAAENLPDIMETPGKSAASDAGKNGILVDLNQYWDTCFTNTDAYYEKEGVDLKSLITNGDGQIFCLSGTVEPVENHITFIYNKDWMDKLGAEIPTTLDEFTDLLRQMKAAGDLNGNGVDDERYLHAPDLLNLTSAMASAFDIEQYEGCDAFVRDENGVVTDEYTSENMKNMLSYLSDLYAEGLISKDITAPETKMMELSAQNAAGVYAFYSSFAISFSSVAPGAADDPDSCQFLVGGPLASEFNNNTNWFVKRYAAYSGNTSVTRECKDPELACKWLDTLFADPVVLLTRTMGQQGIDWDYDENGEPASIPNEDGSVRDIASRGYTQIDLAHIQTREQCTVADYAYPWYKEQYIAMRDNCEWRTRSVPILEIYSNEEQEIADTYKASLVDYFNEMRDKFVTNQADIDAEWDTYVQTMNQLGLKEMTEMYQHVCDRLLG